MSENWSKLFEHDQNESQMVTNCLKVVGNGPELVENLLKIT
jgi:hypothetical protein